MPPTAGVAIAPIWHGGCGYRGMTVAVPVLQERVSPVFDTAGRLLVVRQERDRQVERREFALGALSHEAMVRSVSELHIDVLLCAAISAPLRLALERGGVRVEAHLCGEVEALLQAFWTGDYRRAEFRMPGCWDVHGGKAAARVPPRARPAHANSTNKT